MTSRGFIALMSAVVISAVLIVVIIGGSLIGFYSRFNVFDSESKERSMALAEACVEDMRLQLAQDGSIALGEVEIDAADPTAKCEVVKNTSPYRAQAQFQNAFTNLEVVIDADFNVTYWEEVDEF